MLRTKSNQRGDLSNFIPRSLCLKSMAERTSGRRWNRLKKSGKLGTYSQPFIEVWVHVYLAAMPLLHLSSGSWPSMPCLPPLFQERIQRWSDRKGTSLRWNKKREQREIVPLACLNYLSAKCKTLFVLLCNLVLQVFRRGKFVGHEIKTEHNKMEIWI